MKKPVRIYQLISVATLALLLSLSACTGKGQEKEASTVSSTVKVTEKESSATASESSEVTTEAQSTETQTAVTEKETSATSTEKTAIDTDIVLATLNIKHGAEGLDTIAEAIREVSPDIIGLEEVDVFCERSDYMDEPAEIAQLAGYPYYAFSKAIDLGDGEYGTAILSRYPIEFFEVFPLESGNGENRSLGHAVVDVEGLKLDVFVTHLSYESRSLRIEQMESISNILYTCDYYALMGDLNSFNLEDISYLGGAYYVNRPDRSYVTFHRRSMAIDNIVVSRGFTELSSAVSDRECSDHKLLYAVFHLYADLNEQ